MKTLVLGNSHVGAIYSAYKELKNLNTSTSKKPEVVFAAIPQKELDECKLIKSKLFTSKGAQQRLSQTSTLDQTDIIDLNSFEKVILVGGASPLNLILQIDIAHHCCIQPFSTAIAKEIAFNHRSDSSLIHKKSDFFSSIEEARGSSVTWVPAPLPSTKTPGLKWIEKINESEKNIQIANNTLIRELCNTRNNSRSKSKIFLQKESTLCQYQCRTHARYFANGRRFNGDISRDHYHANLDYGKIILNSIFEQD